MSYKNLCTSPGYALSFAPCKGIRDSLVFWIPRHEFQIPGTGFHILCQWNLDSGFQWLVGFRIPWAVFWIQKPRIPDSRVKTWFLDSAFHKQNLPGFRITQAKICRIPESGVLYTGQISRTDASLSCTHSFFVDHWRIEDITCPRVDTNFIFECSTRYLTRSLRSLVRYWAEHEKIQFVSSSGHVIFCLLYRHRWRDAVMLFSYWLRLKLPWQPWYLHMWRIKIVSSLDTKFSSLEKSWYFIATCISLVIKIIILETLNSAKQIILRKN